jgi:hypothetical protein
MLMIRISTVKQTTLHCTGPFQSITVDASKINPVQSSKDVILLDAGGNEKSASLLYNGVDLPLVC